MAIKSRTIHKGKIICDQCEESIAEIEAPTQTYDLLLEEAQFIKIVCWFCNRKQQL